MMIVEFYKNYNKMGFRREQLRKEDGLYVQVLPIHTIDGHTFWMLRAAYEKSNNLHVDLTKIEVIE